MVKADYQDYSKKELIKEIKKLNKRKKYGIVWEDKVEKVAELCKEKLPVLVTDENRKIAMEKEKPVNILIEGDNYHALSVLNYTHKDAVDIIYIDPPYNTGNDAFKFNDKIVDREDTYRHSKWLSFMEKRLFLAKKLLRNTGVIFISIDDNEQAQLKLLCDGIFGAQNFVANYIWEARSGKGATAKNVVFQHEYVLCYSKNINKLKLKQDVRIKEGGTYLDGKGKYQREQLRQWGQGDKKEDRPTMYYPVKSPNGEDIYPTRTDGSDGRWRVSSRKMNKLIQAGDVEYVFDGERWQLFRKIRAGRRTKTPFGTFLMGLGTASTGTIELKQFFKEKVFDTTKPLGLVKYLLNLVDDSNNAIVLDFYAGSGTTGHAVLELNNEDDGKRKFILCTNNENNICKQVCYPRIEMAIKGYVNPKGEKVLGLGGNLTYLKTDFVSGEPTDFSKKELVEKSTEMLCLKEDCFEEMETGQYYRIYKSNQDKYLGIVYDDNGIFPLKIEIQKIGKKFVVYVFSLDESAREDEFEDVQDLVKLKPIPAVILAVYRRIFK